MKMNKIMALLACAAVALPYGVRAQGEESAVSASAEVAVPSAYVWRGMVVVDDVVVQPTFTVSKGGLSLNWWGNMTTTDDTTGSSGEFSEHDITVSYSGLSCPLTGAAISMGVVNFDFPNTGLVDAEGNLSLVNDTREAFLSYSLADVLLAPTATINYDFNEADGFYFLLGVSHSIEVAEGTSLNLGANIGGSDSDWGGYYFGDASGLTDWGISATLPIAINGNWTVTPGLQYVALLDDAKDAVDASGDSLYFGDTDKFLGSVKLSYAF